MSYILNIGTAIPEYRYSQRDLVAPIASLYEKNSPARRKVAALLGRSAIDYRFSVLPDFSGNGKASFYPFDSRSFCMPNVGQRMEMYKKMSVPLATKAVENVFSATPLHLSQVTHLITVSCTGMTAPGIEILLSDALGLSENIQRATVNFMGCYAAFHGLKLARLMAMSDPDALILVVCVELSTLHLRADESDDNLLSSVIFGDGAAAVLVSSKPVSNQAAISMEGFYSSLIRDADEDMQWNVAPDGFRMNLTSRIPDHVERHLGSFYNRILEKRGLQREDISHFAIHPGGKKILEAFASSLNINASTLEPSFWVLRNYGNMSSPSVLFVLKRIWETAIHPDSNPYIFSAAFGPGLTVESAVLRHG